MKNTCLALTATLMLATSAEAADLSQQSATVPPPPPSLPNSIMPIGSSVPNSAFFLGLGASANWTNFGDQRVYAIGTSDVFTDGVQTASGSAQGPTRIPMESRFAFAPSFQGGYFQRLGASDWLWGAKLSYNYLGSTSTNTNSIIPQFGTYTTIENPNPVTFSGPAYVRAAKTSLYQEIDFIPFLGHVLGQSTVYAGFGPTLSQTRTQLNGLVGFALVDGAMVDQSGAPQDFSSSRWLFGRFLDLSYTYAFTQGHTAIFASPFVDRNGGTSVGTLVGNSAWTAQTQRVGLTKVESRGTQIGAPMARSSGCADAPATPSYAYPPFRFMSRAAAAASQGSIRRKLLFRRMGIRPIASVNFSSQALVIVPLVFLFWGKIDEVDIRIGVVAVRDFLVGGAHAADLIQNGSFETASDGSSLPTGNGSELPSGSTDIADWTVFGGPGSNGIAWLPNGDGYGVTTPFGAYFLDLTGYSDTSPYFGVEQTISTVAGQTYALTFDLGVDQSSGIYNGPVSVTASAGSTSEVLGPYDPAGAGNQWGAFTLDFTATSASTLISIQGEEGDQYIGLDNVAVNQTAGAVPETSTWAMMLIGFAGFAFVGYRNAKTNKALAAA